MNIEYLQLHTTITQIFFLQKQSDWLNAFLVLVSQILFPDMFNAKGQFFLKGPMVSPKKRTNEFVFFS